MDNALRMFEELDRLGIAKIEAFLSEQQEENLFLDFKEKTFPDVPGLSKEDRKVYAKTLSAFSNASGGVTVWGIEAREDRESPDVAKEKKPIMHLKKFLTDLNSLISDAIVPLNTGIVNKLIFITGDWQASAEHIMDYLQL